MTRRIDLPVFGFVFAAAVGVAYAAETPPTAVANPAFVDPVFSAPIGMLQPGDPPAAKKPGNPAIGDPKAIQRGMNDFVSFNCVGCHAANGGGGMGPSLSDAQWIYGSAPSDIFLTIYQGRPNGMPTWGRTLPQSTIWDLVAYVTSIAKKPGPPFGRTFSRDPSMAPQQQTPAEFLSTADPWGSTEPFTNGQKPRGR